MFEQWPVDDAEQVALFAEIKKTLETIVIGKAEADSCDVKTYSQYWSDFCDFTREVDAKRQVIINAARKKQNDK